MQPIQDTRFDIVLTGTRPFWLSLNNSAGLSNKLMNVAGVLERGGVHARDGDRPLLRALYDPLETLYYGMPGQRASREQTQALSKNSEVQPSALQDWSEHYLKPSVVHPGTCLCFGQTNQIYITKL